MKFENKTLQNEGLQKDLADAQPTASGRGKKTSEKCLADFKSGNSFTKNYASRALVKYISEYSDEILAAVEEIEKRKPAPGKRNNPRAAKFLRNEIELYREALKAGKNLERWKVPKPKEKKKTPKPVSEVCRRMNEIMRDIEGKKNIELELEGVRKKVSERYYHTLAMNAQERCADAQRAKRLVKETVGDYVFLLLSSKAAHRRQAKEYICNHLEGNADVVFKRINEIEPHIQAKKYMHVRKAMEEIRQKLPANYRIKTWDIGYGNKSAERNRIEAPVKTMVYIDSHEWEIPRLERMASSVGTCTINLAKVFPSGEGSPCLHDLIYPVLNGSRPAIVLLDGIDRISGYFGKEKKEVQMELAKILSGNEINFLRVDERTGEIRAYEYNAKGAIFMANGKFPMLEYIINARLFAQDLPSDMKRFISGEIEPKAYLLAPREKLLHQVCRDDLEKYGMAKKLLSQISDVARLPSEKEQDLLSVEFMARARRQSLQGGQKPASKILIRK